jgi:hypothetical protein
MAAHRWFHVLSINPEAGYLNVSPLRLDKGGFNMASVTRRSVLSGLAGAGASFMLTNPLIRPAQAQVEAIDWGAVIEIFEDLFATVEVVADASSGVLDDKDKVFSNVVAKSEKVLGVQQEILGKVKNLRLVFRGKIAEVFERRTQMELASELDSLRILLADGKPTLGPHLAEKAQRLERLSYEIGEKYGPAGFPAFMASAAATYTVHKMQKTDRPVIASIMKTHSAIVDGWLKDNQPGAISERVRDIKGKSIKTSGDERVESLYTVLQKAERSLNTVADKLSRPPSNRPSIADPDSKKSFKPFSMPAGPEIKL